MESLGHICTLNRCEELNCKGTHYYYYSEPHETLVVININGINRYILPEGYNVYYRRQLANITDHMEYRSSHDFTDNERPTKRARYY